jgi:hypothetical protein
VLRAIGPLAGIAPLRHCATARCYRAKVTGSRSRADTVHSSYKGFPTFVKQDSTVVNREAIDHEFVFPRLSLRHSVNRVVAHWVQSMWTAKLQTVIAASSILRTLMKDARQGLHSLVEAQGIAAMSTSKL